MNSPHTPPSKIGKRYDAVIIGAGIGGLVCGSYLAKLGKKVLIVEKNSRPGGHCISTRSDGYVFNLGITSFGNLGKKSKLRQIFKDLDVYDKMKFKQINPANIILTPEHKLEFGSDTDHIIDQLASAFPNEKKAIHGFINYLMSSNLLNLYVELKNKTYKQFLDENFTDERLKSIFCVFLGPLGLPSGEVAALSAVTVLKEFIISGGYFLENDHVDVIPNLLAESFMKKGGDMLLSTEVDSICIDNNEATGIRVGNDLIGASATISTCDPAHTYKKLLGDGDTAKTLMALKVTGSAFVLYATIKKGSMEETLQPNIWLCDNYDTQDDIPSVFSEDRSYFRTNCLFLGVQSRYNAKAYPSDRIGAFVIVNAEFKNKAFWEDRGDELREIILDKLRRMLQIKSGDMLSVGYLTPIDLRKITNNLRGAMRGWASTVSQNSRETFSSNSKINNLYFTGQWVTSDYVQGGVVMAALNGNKLANFLKKRYKKRGALVCS